MQSIPHGRLRYNGRKGRQYILAFADARAGDPVHQPAGGWDAHVGPGVHLGLCAAAIVELYARGAWTDLSLEAEVQQATLIPVAYPRREDFKPAYREPIQKFTHWDSGSPTVEPNPRRVGHIRDAAQCDRAHNRHRGSHQRPTRSAAVCKTAPCG